MGTQTHDSPETTPSPQEGHLSSYPRFLWRSLVQATDGSVRFYVWMTFLTVLALVGCNAWAEQVATGMVTTNMTDHVSWGLYIANFTFMVGLAAGGVMMVIPAYLYDDEEMHDVVIFGELLAIAAIVMSLAFVVVDMGRPDRFWHIIPLIGRFNWPISMLTWDVIVLNGYLLLNLHITGYLIYTKYRGEKPKKSWYIPFVLLSIVWAISIHTVTAFLYSGLGGRPFWNSAILAPRFLVSAFVAGPAFIILTLQVIRRFAGVNIPDGAIRTLGSILKVMILINLFLVGAEIFTEFYTGGTHTESATYLYFGLHGHHALVPWIWTALGLNVLGALTLLHPASSRHLWVLDVACVMVIVGVWIEKGMGLIIPAFVPSTMHEIVEYMPSLTEWQITVGIWALGMLVYTIALKVAIPVFKGDMSAREPASIDEH